MGEKKLHNFARTLAELIETQFPVDAVVYDELGKSVRLFKSFRIKEADMERIMRWVLGKNIPDLDACVKTFYSICWKEAKKKKSG